MALSQLQVNVLRTVADDDAVPVSYLVACQENTGTRLTVARAALSRSLRRLWRLGAVVECAAGGLRSPWGIPRPEVPNGGRMPVFGPQPRTSLPAGVPNLKDIPTVSVR